jgi:glutathione synthase/RimK-type ligase-like ATP-grasp enzyme
MGLVFNPGIIWVNPIDRVSVAELKLYQLQVARELGFRVPRTLVSRDPAELRRFADARRRAGPHPD